MPEGWCRFINYIRWRAAGLGIWMRWRAGVYGLFVGAGGGALPILKLSAKSIDTEAHGGGTEEHRGQTARFVLLCGYQGGAGSSMCQISHLQNVTYNLAFVYFALPPNPTSTTIPFFTSSPTSAFAPLTLNPNISDISDAVKYSVSAIKSFSFSSKDTLFISVVCQNLKHCAGPSVSLNMSSPLCRSY